MSYTKREFEKVQWEHEEDLWKELHIDADYQYQQWKDKRLQDMYEYHIKHYVENKNNDERE